MSALSKPYLSFKYVGKPFYIRMVVWVVAESMKGGRQEFTADAYVLAAGTYIVADIYGVNPPRYR
jgi:hypothetical protein